MRVRYDTPDEGINGNPPTTRRDRNEGHEFPSPLFIVPPIGRYLWDWYYDLSDRLRRVRSGVCEPIPPSEYIAWKAATGNIVWLNEYAVLSAMDVAFCDEMNKELADYRERQAEAAKNPPKG